MNFDKFEQVVIRIERARKLASADSNGFSDPYAVVQLGEKGEKKKTNIVAKSLNPKWESVFAFPVTSSSSSNLHLFIEVWDHDKVGKNDFLGQCSVKNVHELPFDHVKNLWIPLQPRSAQDILIVSGEINIQIIRTRKTLDLKQPENVFFYRDPGSAQSPSGDRTAPTWKTGDMIVFGGYGAVANLVKLRTKIDFTHAGIVVRLANKFTKKEEYFLFSVTGTGTGLVEAFTGVVPSNGGVSLFRIDERIHHFPGACVGLCSLKERLTKEQRTNLLRAVAHVYGKNPDPDLLTFPCNEAEKKFIHECDLHTKVAKNSSQILDNIVEPITKIYQDSGINLSGNPHEPFNTSNTSLRDLMTSPVFAPPVFLRATKGNTIHYAAQPHKPWSAGDQNLAPQQQQQQQQQQPQRIERRVTSPHPNKPEPPQTNIPKQQYGGLPTQPSTQRSAHAKVPVNYEQLPPNHAEAERSASPPPAYQTVDLSHK